MRKLRSTSPRLRSRVSDCGEISSFSSHLVWLRMSLKIVDPAPEAAPPAALLKRDEPRDSAPSSASPRTEEMMLRSISRLRSRVSDYRHSIAPLHLPGVVKNFLGEITADSRPEEASKGLPNGTDAQRLGFPPTIACESSQKFTGVSPPHLVWLRRSEAITGRAPTTVLIPTFFKSGPTEMGSRACF